MRARDVLQRLKADDDHNIGVVTLFIQDRLLSRLAATWSSVARVLPRDSNPNEEYPPDTPPEFMVRWLWARIEPEPEPVWAEMTGLPLAPHVLRAMRVLQDIGAVFPDGTLSKWVSQYLTSEAKRIGVESSPDVVAPI